MMMRMAIPGFALLLLLSLGMSGCGKVGGPTFWWDDRTQTRLSDEYELPADPGAPVNTDEERKAVASGEDITDESLDSFHTDLDLQEERRKTEEGLFDF